MRHCIVTRLFRIAFYLITFFQLPCVRIYREEEKTQREVVYTCYHPVIIYLDNCVNGVNGIINFHM